MYQELSAKSNYKSLFRRRVGSLRLHQKVYRAGDWNKKHRHENARFVFVYSGTFTEKYEGKERFCKPLTCIFRPPLETHSEIYNKGVNCLSVDITQSWLLRLAKFSVELKSSSDFRTQTLSHLITKLSSEMAFDDDVSVLAIDSLLTEIAVEMHRRFSDTTQDKHPRWLKMVVEYMQENAYSNLSLNEIASVANVHPVHLSRTFRRHYHQTVAEYIRGIRIESARTLLYGSDLTLAQIAAHVGFADQSHFTKIFKRLTFETPAQFRKRVRIS